MVGTTVGNISNVMLFEVAVAGLTHVALDVSITVTTSLSAGVLYVYVGALAPTLVPLTCHWYVGLLPGFTGVAVNVIGVPAHCCP
jgi:hypothetical protein